MLSKSAQYRRLLKMYGSGSTAGQEAPLVVDGVQDAAQQAQQGEQAQQGGRSNDGAANDGCQMCQYVVQYVKIALASNETIAQVGWGVYAAGLEGSGVATRDAVASSHMLALVLPHGPRPWPLCELSDW